MKFYFAFIISILFGFISLSYEIIWIRAYSFVSGNSPVTFGLLVGFYLIGLALGSFVVRVYCRDEDNINSNIYLVILSIFVLLANIFGFCVLPLLSFFSTKVLWIYTLPIVSLAASMLGVGLPLISHYSIKPDIFSGSYVSYLYMGNIFGSTVGSLLTGFIFLNVLSIKNIAVTLGFIGILIFVVLILATGLRLKTILVATFTLLIFGIFMFVSSRTLFDTFYEKLQYKTDYINDKRFSDIIENRSGVITVSSNKVVYGNGAYDGIISTDLVKDINDIVRAYALGAFHNYPKKILIIGLGSGSWAQVISNLTDVVSVTIVEINPGYVELVSRYNNVSSLLDNKRVEIIIDDARRWLSNNPDSKFDFIVANTTWHWRSHATNVLSIEFMDLIREHLLPNGIYYFNTTGSNEAIKTSLTAFKYGYRFLYMMAVSDQPFKFNKERLGNILKSYKIDDEKVFDFSKNGDKKRFKEILSFADKLESREYYGIESKQSLLNNMINVPVITDDNMLSEWKNIVLQP